jgi:hypothetical protein
MDKETEENLKEEAYDQALKEIYYNNYDCEADADCFAFFADSDPEFLERYNKLLEEKIEEYKRIWE